MTLALSQRYASNNPPHPLRPINKKRLEELSKPKDVCDPPPWKFEGFIFPTAEEKLKEVRALKRASYDHRIDLFGDAHLTLESMNKTSSKERSTSWIWDSSLMIYDHDKAIKDK